MFPFNSDGNQMSTAALPGCEYLKLRCILSSHSPVNGNSRCLGCHTMLQLWPQLASQNILGYNPNMV